MGLLEWYRNYQIEKLRLKLEAQNKPYDALISIVQQTTEATKSQTKVLEEWMNSFKVTELPKSTVIRDVDEWQAEQARENLHGEVINPAITESLTNAMKAGAFPELKDILNLS